MGLEIDYDKKKALCDALSHLAGNNFPFKLSKELGKTLRDARSLERFNTAVGVPGYDTNADGLVLRKLVQKWPEMDHDVREMLFGATASSQLVGLILYGDVGCVAAVVDVKRFDPAKFGEYCESGNVEAVKTLMSHVDPINNAIGWAARNGHIEVVELLLTDGRADPSANSNCAIRLAAEYGYAKVVELLLADKRINPSAGDNYAIRWAALNEHFEVVKLLLADKRVDPSAALKIKNLTPEMRTLLQP